MKNERFQIRTAYACNDLARIRQGPQDIIGYDVYDTQTGVVEIPCETTEEATEEAKKLNNSI